MSTKTQEDLTYRELKTALESARDLLDRTESWADRWHQNEPARGPFSVGGLFQGTALQEVGYRAHAYAAAADRHASPGRVYTVTGLTPGDHTGTVRVFQDEGAALAFAKERGGDHLYQDEAGRTVYSDGHGGDYTVTPVDF